MATTIFKCIFHMSIECLKPTISVVSLAKLAQSLLSLATIAKLVDNQQTFSCTLFWPFASPSSTATLVSCASCFSVLYSSYLASGFLFSMCSHCVPKRFPKMFLGASQFYPIFCGHNSTSMYIKKRGCRGAGAQCEV